MEIQKYEGLIRSIAKKYVSFNSTMDDLVQEGYIGILEAQKRYDPNKGASFETYASYWIKKRVLAFLDKQIKFNKDNVQFTEGFNQHDQDHAIVEEKETKLTLPKGLPEIEEKIIRLQYERDFSLKEVAEQLNLRREKVRALREKALRRLRAQGFLLDRKDQ